jgi:hypothetical protein
MALGRWRTAVRSRTVISICRRGRTRDAGPRRAWPPARQLRPAGGRLVPAVGDSVHDCGVTVRLLIDFTPSAGGRCGPSPGSHRSITTRRCRSSTATRPPPEPDGSGDRDRAYCPRLLAVGAGLCRACRASPVGVHWFGPSSFGSRSSRRCRVARIGRGAGPGVGGTVEPVVIGIEEAAAVAVVRTVPGILSWNRTRP